MNSLPPAIEAQELTKRFGALLAVDHVTLTIPRSQIFGFLGPNGSGKSTTIRMLCGLLRPDSGSILALGLRIPQQTEALRTRLGYMTQRFALWEDLTARENLHFMANIYTLPRADIVSRVAELTVEYHLDAFLDRPAGTLSGGQKQRLALAAATIHRPELLLLDEPTSAVDPQSRRDFWDSLFKLTAAGTTILVSTHYMDEAERCHQLAILDHGRVMANGSPQQLRAALRFDVIEVDAVDVMAARRILQSLDGMRSVAQLGVRLHALFDATAMSAATPGTAGTDATLERVQAALVAAGLDGRARRVEPSLEDVFVGATMQAPPPPSASRLESAA